ncbi:MAG: DNA polymerase III subunit [Patescibacteria group bacterium]|nr:DNA polymerase III subunit [Patescibacteria group bacterium]
MLYENKYFRYNSTMSDISRPIVGHEKISQFLQKSLDQNKLAHAYLFSGQEHLGKTLLAENFIASVLCADYHKANGLTIKSIPCGECSFCLQLKKGIHPDVYFLKKEEEKKNISVEQVREMKKFLGLTSFLNSYRFALVENAEILSEGAQNALLKILEEPGDKVILILLVSDHNLLVPTIVSRCQLIRFYPLSDDKIYDHLVTLGAKREQAKILTAACHGQIGQAINYFQNPELFSARLEKTKENLSLFNENLAERFKLIGEMLKSDEEDLNFGFSDELNLWQLILRDILLCQNNVAGLITNLHFEKEINTLADKYSRAKIMAALSKVNEIKKYLAFNVNQRLAAENLILTL